METIESFSPKIKDVLNCSEEESEELAERVLSYFFDADNVVDNNVIMSDRKIFYKLHKGGLLKSYKEKVTLQNGRTWRIFYWEIDGDNFKIKPEKNLQVFYNELPPEYWDPLPIPLRPVGQVS